MLFLRFAEFFLVIFDAAGGRIHAQDHVIPRPYDSLAVDLALAERADILGLAVIIIAQHNLHFFAMLRNF